MLLNLVLNVEDLKMSSDSIAEFVGMLVQDIHSPCSFCAHSSSEARLKNISPDILPPRAPESPSIFHVQTHSALADLACLNGLFVLSGFRPNNSRPSLAPSVYLYRFPLGRVAIENAPASKVAKQTTKGPSLRGHFAPLLACRTE